MSALVWPLLQLGGSSKPAAKAERTRKKNANTPVEPPLSWTEAAWYLQLDAVAQHRLQGEVKVATVAARTRLPLGGEENGYWYGILSGLVVMFSDCSLQPCRAGVGYLPGTWFAESALLQSQSGLEEALAVCESRIARVPAWSFYRLLAESKAFSCFVTEQLEAQVRRFTVSREICGISDNVSRVARALGNLFVATTATSREQAIRITQAQVGELCCLSRPKVNQALACLEKRGWIKTEYGGLRIIDLVQLQQARIG